jgi:tRNA uridine 5-carboxymethylaminomethyl modification enzyme
MILDKLTKTHYDTIVVGGGHAGTEAACASARTGANSLLITMTLNNLGELSCNPSIGGIAKGTIVREIDALDGIMGRLADETGTHFKILNASKGPAVHSPRAQIDRELYKKTITKILSKYENLDVLTGEVIDIIIKNKTTKGIIVKIFDHQNKTKITKTITADSVIITTGTFLNGVIHVWDKTYEAGRRNEPPSKELAKKLREIDFNIQRMKTGTPARIQKDSIDYSDLEIQKGDKPPKPFSFINKEITQKQIPCHITYTNEETHKIIAANAHKSAMRSGNITGIGPRYCPSIEDKIVRFADKTRHQIFLESEGYTSDLVYPNGISTSLPEKVQSDFIHSIKGLENCKISTYGYAIEYDFVDPRELYPTLETKKISGLYFAGQINGTTGYEEAGGQGLIAGLNAGLKKQNKEFILSRTESYIGVLIDDLITKGTMEPYRMFTSRAEYRLLLRSDNADLRLTPKIIELNCISEKRKKIFQERLNNIKSARELMQNLKATPNQLAKYGIKIRQDGIQRTAFEIFAFPNVTINDLKKVWTEIEKIDTDTIKQIKIEAGYNSYLIRQQKDIELFKKEENLKIPKDFDYKKIPSLSNEVCEKLTKAKPTTIGVASRIRGITPAAIIAIMIYLKGQK